LKGAPRDQGKLSSRIRRKGLAPISLQTEGDRAMRKPLYSHETGRDSVERHDLGNHGACTNKNKERDEGGKWGTPTTKKKKTLKGAGRACSIKRTKDNRARAAQAGLLETGLEVDSRPGARKTSGGYCCFSMKRKKSETLRRKSHGARLGGGERGRRTEPRPR